MDEGDRYPRVLEHLLRERFPGRRIDVFNAGMDGYTSKHSLINYVSALAYARLGLPEVEPGARVVNRLDSVHPPYLLDGLSGRLQCVRELAGAPLRRP